VPSETTENACFAVYILGNFQTTLKERSHGIFSYFFHVQNYFLIDGNLEQRYKNTRETMISHKGTRMVKHGDD